MNTKMNTYNKTVTAALLATLALTGATAFGAIDMAMVKVGDAGNAADGDTGGIYGAVAYEYQIGKYEVTNAQYAAFLNAVATTDTYSLYHTQMGSNNQYGGITRKGDSGSYIYEVKAGWGNKAVAYVTFWDAARFTNWLTNGQGGAGTTETGVYNLTTEGITANSILRDATAWANGGYAITSEDEWYKAAYYNGDGSYRQYPVTGELSWENANYYNPNYYEEGTDGGTGKFAMPGGTYIADVDFYDEVTGASSFYETYQQGGNLWEWVDNTTDPAARTGRGGSFNGGDQGSLVSSVRGSPTAAGTGLVSGSMGFRVVVFSPTAVPEPGSYAAATGLSILVIGMWVRRGRRAWRG
ncbi:MAG: formylglycine-generating enzyme family protein [Opitutaceae bacterium]|jgi:formylglycine-generating enzyme required for sulfatase activity|nr:formylglycine-generating enzyme family protein [Opitutaceae bacterium]